MKHSLETYKYIKNNWKKLASARDDSELEESFMRQANGFVQNKARPLFRDPYLLGFEIVHRPDDSNTRMVGMYGFRVSKKMFYVPVIFFNGGIKGVESIYSDSEKLFYPLNAGWCSYILSREEKDSGKIVDTAKSKAKDQTIDPEKTLNFDGATKQASVKAFKDILELVYNSEDTSSLLVKAAKDHGDKIFNDLIKFAQANDDVAEGLARFVDIDEMIDASNEFKPVTKQASEKSNIVLHLGRFTKSGSFENLENGYSFVDNRDLTKLANVTTKSENAFKTVSNLAEEETILFTDGKLRKALPLGELIYCDDEVGVGYYNDVKIRYLWLPKEQCLIDSSNTRNLTALDEVSVPLNELSYTKEKPRGGGKNWMFILPDGAHGVLYNVLSTSTTENITTIKCGEKYRDIREIDDPDSVRFYTINHDKESTQREEGYKLKSFGRDVRFIEIPESYRKNISAFPEDFSKASLHNFLDSETEFKVFYDKSASLYKVACNDTESHWGKEMYTTGQMMQHLNLSQTAVSEILETAKNEGLFKGYLDKSASQINLSIPAFNSPSYSSYYDANVDESEEEIIEAESNIEPEKEVEDIQDTNKANVLRNGSPMDILNISIQIGSPQMFNAGALSGLAGTYDANYYLDQYMTDLIQALDKMGRIIFLFYWRPDDMQTAFGSDDLAKLESTIISTYKSYGDMLLEFLKKNRSDKQV